MNIQKMMKQAAKMQEQMAQTQAELADKPSPPPQAAAKSPSSRTVRAK